MNEKRPSVTFSTSFAPPRPSCFRFACFFFSFTLQREKSPERDKLPFSVPQRKRRVQNAPPRTRANRCRLCCPCSCSSPPPPLRPQLLLRPRPPRLRRAAWGRHHELQSAVRVDVEAEGERVREARAGLFCLALEECEREREREGQKEKGREVRKSDDENKIERGKKESRGKKKKGVGSSPSVTSSTISTRPSPSSSPWERAASGCTCPGEGTSPSSPRRWSPSPKEKELKKEKKTLRTSLLSPYPPLLRSSAPRRRPAATPSPCRVPFPAGVARRRGRDGGGGRDLGPGLLARRSTISNRRRARGRARRAGPCPPVQGPTPSKDGAEQTNLFPSGMASAVTASGSAGGGSSASSWKGGSEFEGDDCETAAGARRRRAAAGAAPKRRASPGVDPVAHPGPPGLEACTDPDIVARTISKEPSPSMSSASGRE